MAMVFQEQFLDFFRENRLIIEKGRDCAFEVDIIKDVKN